MAIRRARAFARGPMGGVNRSTPSPPLAARASLSCRLPLFDLTELDQLMELFRVAESVTFKRVDDVTVDDERNPMAQQKKLVKIGRNNENPGSVPHGAFYEAVNLLTSADIDADRRLVQQKDARARIAPFGENNFLLIAAGQISNSGRRPKRPDRQFLDGVLRFLYFQISAYPAQSREVQQSRQTEIALN